MDPLVPSVSQQIPYAAAGENNHLGSGGVASSSIAAVQSQSFGSWPSSNVGLDGNVSVPGEREEEDECLLSQEPSLWDKVYHFDVKVTGGNAVEGLRLSVTTDLDVYKSRHIHTERTYEDFVSLHTHLVKLYPECITPALPPLRNTLLQPDQELNKTVKALCTWLKTIGRHPILVRDEGTVCFFGETKAFFASSKSQSQSSSRWSKKFKSFVSVQPKDVDQSFENAKRDTQMHETGLQEMKSCIDKVARCRKALAASLIDLSAKVSAFGKDEVNKNFTTVCAKAGNRLQCSAEKKISHADAEYSIIMDFSVLGIKNCQATQAALNHRLAILTLYDSACKSTERQQKKMEKLKGNSNLNQEKVNTTIERHAELVREESTLRSQFRSISDQLRRDFKHSEETRVLELGELLKEYVVCQLELGKKEANDVWDGLKL